MNEQIILEFKGETAGLTKAVEVLEKISGIAEEQLAAFRRVNTEQQQYVRQLEQNALKSGTVQKQLMEGSSKLYLGEKNLMEQVVKGNFALLQQDAANYSGFQQKKTAVAKEQGELRKKLSEEELKPARELMSAIGEGLAGLSKQGTEIYKVQLEEKLKQLQREREAELSNQNLTATQKAAINEKYRKQEADIKRKEFEADKAAKIVQAIIAMALAVVKALPNPITAALAASAGAAQVALITAQPTPRFYAKGGKNISAGMAVVGEEGPELLYVPQGSSIIPDKDTQTLLQKWGVPSFNVQAPLTTERRNEGIDYHKLGEVLAEKLKANPQHKITIDRNGFTYHLLSKARSIERLNGSYEA